MSNKKEMNYCRRGYKPATLFLNSEDKKAGTCSLEDADGRVRVTQLPLIADPEKAKPGELPDSYATPAAAGADRAPSTVDTEKVAAVLSKAQAPDAAVTDDDLDRVNIPTLRAITEGLQMDDPPKGAKSDDIKEAIKDAANAAEPEEGSGAGSDPVEDALKGGGK